MKIKTSQDVFLSIRIAHAEQLIELCERIEINIIHKSIIKSWSFSPHDCPFIQQETIFQVDNEEWCLRGVSYYIVFGDAQWS